MSFVVSKVSLDDEVNVFKCVKPKYFELKQKYLDYLLPCLLLWWSDRHFYGMRPSLSNSWISNDMQDCTHMSVVLLDLDYSCATGSPLQLCFRISTTVVLQDLYCSCASGSWLQLCFRILTTAVLQDHDYSCASGSWLQLCFRIFTAAVLLDLDYSCAAGSWL